ncbi:MAG: LppX_LprAFG lipoprotein [Nocardioides sp.]
MRRSPLTPAVVLTAVLALAACGGEEPVSSDKSPEDVMALAKTTLDETTGVRLSLSSSDMPTGVTAIKSASGIGIHPPAFEGSLTVVLGGTDFEVPVIAVDDAVHAEIPLTPGWSEVDPADYGAPDPAGLMSTDAGFSSLLAASEDLEQGDSVRGGEGNKEVLTEYTGTVPGDVVSNVIPSAEGDFDASYTISAEGELREAVLTGVFYPDTAAMTYTIGFDDYGAEKKITAP